MNTKHNLKNQVLSGLLILSCAASASLVAAPSTADAATPSLYDQYQQEQQLKELKAKVQAAQKEVMEEAERNQKQEKPEQPAAGSEENGAQSFVDRIQAILDSYEGPDNRFREYYNAHRQKKEVPESQVLQPVPKKAEAKTEPKAEKPEAETGKEDSLEGESALQEPKNLDPHVAVAGGLPAIPSTPTAPASSQSLGTEGRYNFDWRGTPLAQSIYGVAKIAGKGVVVNTDIKGNVFMSLKQVTCDQALNYLASAFGLNWMTDGDNIIVSTGDLMKQSKVFPIGYANKKNLTEELAAIGIDKGHIYANTETGTVSVTGTPYQLKEAEKRIQALDHPVAQCLILAQLIEISHGKELNLGFQYTLPTYSHEASESGDGSSLHGNWIDKLTFSASSQASRELNKGKVIARPMVLSLNGQKGTVDFGDRVPVLTRTDTGSTNTLTVTYEDVGTKLEFTPEINETTGDITLTLTTEVSNITGWVTSGDTRAPQMSTRKATTSAHIKSGQSFVIGGLMSGKELDNLSGIPGLMNLPILGKLFSYHTHSRTYGEVYVMITPFIVSDKVNARDIYDELRHLDRQARKNDINVPDSDWTKAIGQHRENHRIAE